MPGRVLRRSLRKRMITSILSNERISLEPPTPSFAGDLERKLLGARRDVEARARAAPPAKASALLRRFEEMLAKLDALVVRALADGLVAKSEAKVVLLATSRAS